MVAWDTSFWALPRSLRVERRPSPLHAAVLLTRDGEGEPPPSSTVRGKVTLLPPVLLFLHGQRTEPSRA